jgi:pimeloyl-ACP methyl ester carboxylesterase
MSRATTFLAILTALALGGAAPAQQPAGPLDKAPSKFVKADDGRVHYKSLGEGKTAVVLVHGWTSNMDAWHFQAKDLAGKTRLILIDLPGHGKSDKPEVKYTMDRFAKAVDAVLADAGVEQAVLAGHSMGTPVIRQYYRLYPKKTKALVVVDGVLQPPPFLKDPKMADKFLAKFKGSDFKETVSKMLDAMFVAGKAPAEYRAAVLESSLSTPQHVAMSAMHGMADASVWKDDKIGVPVLVLMAKNPARGTDYEQYVRKLVPDVEYHEMDGVGHFLHAEEPAAFNKILIGFLKKQGMIRE